ncbi:MAG: iron ABC transporter permease [Eubacteriales bacterium]
MKNLTNKQRLAVLSPILVGIISILAYFCMTIGYIEVPFERFMATLGGQGTDKENAVIWSFRMPKTAVAIVAGMCLTASGAVMQGVTRNPIATPSLLGVSSGSGLGTLLVVYALDCGYGLVMPQPVASVLGGMVTFFIVYSLALRYKMSPVKLILNGIAINSCIGSISLIITLKLSSGGFTMLSLINAGSLSYATWDMIKFAYLSSIPLFGYIIYKACFLNILNLDDEMAVGLGLNLIKERKKLLIVTVLLTSIASYVAGGIGSIGMIAPHIAKRIVGSNFKLFLPLATLIGITIILFADLTVRILALNDWQFQIGTLISLIGSPYLLYLLFTEDR